MMLLVVILAFSMGLVAGFALLALTLAFLG